MKPEQKIKKRNIFNRKFIQKENRVETLFNTTHRIICELTLITVKVITYEVNL